MKRRFSMVAWSPVVPVVWLVYGLGQAFAFLLACCIAVRDWIIEEPHRFGVWTGILDDDDGPTTWREAWRTAWRFF